MANKMVQRLTIISSRNYGQGLRGRTKNKASRDAYARAIDLLRLFDPQRAKNGLNWTPLSLPVKRSEFEDALGPRSL